MDLSEAGARLGCVAWLSRKTGESYRLLSEAEWEYAARAGTTGRFSWGEGGPVCRSGASHRANFSSCSSDRTEPVGFSAVNRLGLHDMHGNVWEWVEDCYQDSYSGAPSNGSARKSCSNFLGVVRGGSWVNNWFYIRSASRHVDVRDLGSHNVGFRVARTLPR